jgi:hypothetical protein
MPRFRSTSQAESAWEEIKARVDAEDEAGTTTAVAEEGEEGSSGRPYRRWSEPTEQHLRGIFNQMLAKHLVSSRWKSITSGSHGVEEAPDEAKVSREVEGFVGTPEYESMYEGWSGEKEVLEYAGNVEQAMAQQSEMKRAKEAEDRKGFLQRLGETALEGTQKLGGMAHAFFVQPFKEQIVDPIKGFVERHSIPYSTLSQSPDRTINAPVLGSPSEEPYSSPFENFISSALNPNEMKAVADAIAWAEKQGILGGLELLPFGGAATSALDDFGRMLRGLVVKTGLKGAKAKAVEEFGKAVYRASGHQPPSSIFNNIASTFREGYATHLRRGVKNLPAPSAGGRSVRALPTRPAAPGVARVNPPQPGFEEALAGRFEPRGVGYVSPLEAMRRRVEGPSPALTPSQLRASLQRGGPTTPSGLRSTAAEAGEEVLDDASLIPIRPPAQRPTRVSVEHPGVQQRLVDSVLGPSERPSGAESFSELLELRRRHAGFSLGEGTPEPDEMTLRRLIGKGEPSPEPMGGTLNRLLRSTDPRSAERAEDVLSRATKNDDGLVLNTLEEVADESDEVVESVSRAVVAEMEKGEQAALAETDKLLSGVRRPQPQRRAFFHGTAADTDFDFFTWKPGSHGEQGPGIYLTTDPETASRYAQEVYKGKQENARIIKVDLNGKFLVYHPSSPVTHDNYRAWAEFARDNGYDGFVMPYARQYGGVGEVRGATVVVFSNQGVKKPGTGKATFHRLDQRYVRGIESGLHRELHTRYSFEDPKPVNDIRDLFAYEHDSLIVRKIPNDFAATRPDWLERNPNPIVGTQKYDRQGLVLPSGAPESLKEVVKKGRKKKAPTVPKDKKTVKEVVTSPPVVAPKAVKEVEVPVSGPGKTVEELNKLGETIEHGTSSGDNYISVTIGKGKKATYQTYRRGEDGLYYLETPSAPAKKSKKSLKEVVTATETPPVVTPKPESKSLKEVVTTSPTETKTIKDVVTTPPVIEGKGKKGKRVLVATSRPYSHAPTTEERNIFNSAHATREYSMDEVTDNFEMAHTHFGKPHKGGGSTLPEDMEDLLHTYRDAAGRSVDEAKKVSEAYEALLKARSPDEAAKLREALEAADSLHQDALGDLILARSKVEERLADAVAEQKVALAALQAAEKAREMGKVKLTKPKAVDTTDPVEKRSRVLFEESRFMADGLGMNPEKISQRMFDTSFHELNNEQLARVHALLKGHAKAKGMDIEMLHSGPDIFELARQIQRTAGDPISRMVEKLDALFYEKALGYAGKKIRQALSHTPRLQRALHGVYKTFASMPARFRDDATTLELLIGLHGGKQYAAAKAAGATKGMRKWTAEDLSNGALLLDAWKYQTQPHLKQLGERSAKALEARLRPDQVRAVRRVSDELTALQKAMGDRRMVSGGVMNEYSEGIRKCIFDPKYRKLSPAQRQAMMDEIFARTDEPFVRLKMPKEDAEAALKASGTWRNIITDDKGNPFIFSKDNPGNLWVKFKDTTARDGFLQHLDNNRALHNVDDWGDGWLSQVGGGDDMAKAYREQLGEILDLKGSAEETIARGWANVAKHDFLAGVANHTRWTAPGGFVDDTGNAVKMTKEKAAEILGIAEDQVHYIPDNAVWGDLRGRYINREILDVLEDQIALTTTKDGWKWTETAKRWYMKFRGLWKEGKTTLDPRAHGRQIMGNALFSALGGCAVWNPNNLKFYKQAFKEMIDQSPMWERAVKLGICKSSIGEWELGMNALIREGKVGSPSALMEALQANKYSGALLRGQAAARRFASDVYGSEDAVFRFAMWLKEVSKGKKYSEAAIEVHNIMPHYGLVSPFVKKLSNTPGFGAFTRFTAETLKGLSYALQRHPSRLLTYLSLPKAFEMTSNALGIVDPTADAVRADLSRKYGGWTVILGHDDEGMPSFVDLSWMMPGADIIRSLGIENSSYEGQEGFLESVLRVGRPLWLSPELGAITALIGHNAFFDSPIRAIIGSDDDAARLKAAAEQLLPSWMAGRSMRKVLQLIETGKNRYGQEVGTLTTIGDVLLGVAINQYNPEVEMQKLSAIANVEKKKFRNALINLGRNHSRSSGAKKELSEGYREDFVEVVKWIRSEIESTRRAARGE